MILFFQTYQGKVLLLFFFFFYFQVASIVGRAELLMTLFTLITLHLYIRCWWKSRFTLKSQITIAFLSTIALFSKEQGIVAMVCNLPILFLLIAI